MEFQKQWIKTLIPLVLAIFLLAGSGYRLFWINVRYPSPQVQTYELNESIQAGGYTVTFSDWQWADGSIIKEQYPQYRHITDTDGNEYPTSQERIGIAKLTVVKTAIDESALDLTNISFESGAWGGQFDAELMFYLNPDLESLLLQLSDGESTEIIFPIMMLDQQFKSAEWNRIDERIFYIVLQYYPEKLQFAGPVC